MSVTVYKVGGPALEDEGLLAPLAAELGRAPGRVLVVHGGGRRVDRLLGALAIESRFVDGRRATSPAAMEVVEMVLSGRINKALAAGLTWHGIPAAGVSGRDAGLLRVRLRPELGRVGAPESVDPTVLGALWAAGLVPVVSPVGADASGEAVNVNADEAAVALARSLGARALVYLSDVDGVRAGGATLGELDADAAERLLADGTIAGGMALKVRVALEAVHGGVPEVVIAGGGRLRGRFPGTRIAARTAREARA
jgi:acetylglutamate kinase